jgi:hypothetical protein
MPKSGESAWLLIRDPCHSLNGTKLGLGGRRAVKLQPRWCNKETKSTTTTSDAIDKLRRYAPLSIYVTRWKAWDLPSLRHPQILPQEIYLLRKFLGRCYHNRPRTPAALNNPPIPLLRHTLYQSHAKSSHASPWSAFLDRKRATLAESGKLLLAPSFFRGVIRMCSY